MTAKIDKQPPVTQEKAIFETKGVVAASNPKVKGNLPAKLQDVSFQSGKLNQINLNSKEFVTYLVPQDKTGREQAFDDDGVDGLYSMLVNTPLSDETYSVFAATFQ